MREIKRDGLLIGIIVVCLILLVYFNLPPETEPTRYTAKIEVQDNNKIMVETCNDGEINADKLWVEFECPPAIKISNKSGIVGDAFEYDPTKTFEGDYYSISGGEKGVPAYDIHVYVYYSYENQDKLIKEEVLEYRNPNR